MTLRIILWVTPSAFHALDMPRFLARLRRTSARPPQCEVLELGRCSALAATYGP